jgi:predicted nucleotidyltransferase
MCLFSWARAKILAMTPTGSTDAVTKYTVEIFLRMLSLEFDIAGAVLFGSRARGDFRHDSDADLAILLRGQKKPPLPVARQMSRTAFDVMLDTGVLVQALPVWLEDWEHPERSSNPVLLATIRREGIVL